jgi:anti-anti-sigma regulatory factor
MTAGAHPLEDKVWVAIHGEQALVRVAGRGSFKVSTALKEFGLTALDSGCRVVILDMALCVGMDSTFMGVVAGLAGRFKQAGEGSVVMLNLSARTRGLVATLGLDQVVQCFQTGAAPENWKVALETVSRMAVLDASSETPRATAETVLEAHENLVKINPENLPRFKDVLTYLRDDLKKKSGGSPDGP